MELHDAFAEVVLKGHVKAAEQYIARGMNFEALDQYGFTPLIESTIARQFHIIKQLLEKGAKVDTPDITGRTALHWAVDNEDLSICELLLDHQANPNAYTVAGQSVLVLPYLRQHSVLKKLLYQHDAKISFAQDFIQVKLLGHRYALQGQADIINMEGKYVAVEYEGFFLEFSIEIVRYSLERYYHHFKARAFQKYFFLLKEIINIFERASNLLKYQKYTVDFKSIEKKIDDLLDTEVLLLPIAYEGHAISFIRYKDILIRCDRGENSQHEGSVVVYRMRSPDRWHYDFVKKLLYQKQSHLFITQGIQSFLNLEYITNIALSGQTVGNCSWANMEASVLGLLYLLQCKDAIQDIHLPMAEMTDARLMYDQWLKWDKARALEECVQSFHYANPARKATIVTLLGAIFFQAYDYRQEEHVKAAYRILPILMTSEYQYVLKSYLKIYWYDRKTKAGHNLVQLLNVCGVVLNAL